MIIGTAGHIDHGKTALVRALTGVDTDRLPEEQRRGITIELGFAPLALDRAGAASLVDVPGHEAFVRTMLAGASGIDLALLVVAADEGVMPQTREHLAILTLLGVQGGVVALTKCDLVDDPEWMALVTADVAEAVAGTPLAGASIVATSATTGQGIAAVRAALDDAARTIAPRAADDIFRMPIDRAFSVHGTGTVVTGTVWSGTLSRDATVRVLPQDRALRVKGLQSHGRPVGAIGPGERAAIALAGVEVAEVARGSVLVTAPSWRAGRVWRAEVEVLADAEVVLQPRTRVRLHLGTAETSARVVARDGPCEPGTRRAVRVLLDAPLVARGGDRFVLRSLSPVGTIGGGTVVDPLPPSLRARPWPLGAGGDAAARLARLLDEAAGTGVLVEELPVRLGVAPAAVQAIVGREDTVAIGGRVLGAIACQRLEDSLLASLDAMHAAAPLEAACSLQALRARCAAPPEVLEHVLRAASDAGALVMEGGTVRRGGWAPRLSRAQAALLAMLEEMVCAAGLEPPDVDELTERHGPEVALLLAIAERGGRLRRVERNRLYGGAQIDALIDRLDSTLDRERWYTAAEMRDVIGVSRKYAIPLLEYLDAIRLTDRAVDGRRWRGASA